MTGRGRLKVAACTLAAFVGVAMAVPAGAEPSSEPATGDIPQKLLEHVPLNGVEPERYSAFLEGEEVIPGPGDTDSIGFVQLTQPSGTNELCYFIAQYDEAAAEEVVLASAGIYQGVAGATGPLVLDLPIPTDDAKTCVPIDPALLTALASDTVGYYVQFTTSEFPDGSVRGQLEGYAVAGLTFQPAAGLPGSTLEVRPDSPCEGSTAFVAFITAPARLVRGGSGAVIIAVRASDAEPLLRLGDRFNIKFRRVPVTPDGDWSVQLKVPVNARAGDLGMFTASCGDPTQGETVVLYQSRDQFEVTAPEPVAIQPTFTG